ncbi:ankyrin [Coprinellus micaceus]|uniref:Ankyrin n=1 Tax=Coprinellus micaceus TaxID=71717 RepID=A0A4Y7SU59_COPMI|nr:ankyrin [Coprinellus micaceus]
MEAITSLLSNGANPNIPGQALCPLQSFFLTYGTFPPSPNIEHNYSSTVPIQIYEVKFLDRNVANVVHMALLFELRVYEALSFLEYSANPNIRDEYGDTPLHNACTRGHVKTAEYLLEFDASLEIQNKEGNTALHDACVEGHTQVVTNSREDKYGSTPLHDACYYGHVEVAELLLHLEADPKIQDQEGRTALEVAREEMGEASAIMRMLYEQGVVG